MTRTTRWRGAGFPGYRTIAVVVMLAFPWSPLQAALPGEQDPEPFPLEPPDTSSPRATLESFLDNNARGIEALARNEHQDKVDFWFKRAHYCLDLSQVSPDLLGETARATSLLLYEVLTRVGLPEPAESVFTQYAIVLIGFLVTLDMPYPQRDLYIKEWPGDGLGGQRRDSRPGPPLLEKVPADEASSGRFAKT